MPSRTGPRGPALARLFEDERSVGEESSIIAYSQVSERGKRGSASGMDCQVSFLQASAISYPTKQEREGWTVCDECKSTSRQELPEM